MLYNLSNVAWWLKVIGHKNTKVSFAVFRCYAMTWTALPGQQSCPGSGFQELTPAGFLQNFSYRSGSGSLIFLLKQDQDRIRTVTNCGTGSSNNRKVFQSKKIEKTEKIWKKFCSAPMIPNWLNFLDLLAHWLVLASAWFDSFHERLCSSFKNGTVNPSCTRLNPARGTVD